jgi:hypothetical protein
MRRNRLAIGLSLLCALAVWSLPAQSASAASAKNTTAVTCVLANEGLPSWDFEDAHCAWKDPNQHGLYRHVAIENGKATSLAITNENTASLTAGAVPAVIKGTVFGVKIEISCKVAAGSGSLTNEESFSKFHNVKGSITTNLSTCTVAKPGGFGCTVAEPIAVSANVEGVEGLGPGGNEMGLEYKPTGGEIFASIVVGNCFIKGTYSVAGTAIATGNPGPLEKHSGATNVFTNAMTKETLKLAGSAAEFSLSTTVRMAPIEGKAQSPIALTTTT